MENYKSLGLRKFMSETGNTDEGAINFACGERTRMPHRRMVV